MKPFVDYSPDEIRKAAEICLSFSDLCAESFKESLKKHGITDKGTLNLHEHSQNAYATAGVLCKAVKAMEGS